MRKMTLINHAHPLALHRALVRISLCCLIVAGLIGAWFIPTREAFGQTPLKTLVLYDAPPAGVNGNRIGKAYAIMLRNLLGHWNTRVELMPVQAYAAGKLESYDATFYLGSHYDLPLPAAFIADVGSTSKTVVWFRYNLWQYTKAAGTAFTERHGFRFNGLRGMNATPSASQPAPGFFSAVAYKGRTLNKFYDYNQTTSTMVADPDVGSTTIVDPAKARTLVQISNPTSGEQLPYIVRSGNFWYVADLPLSFIGPRDRYLVLCDILHDMLGVPAPETPPQALVRFEDVSALVVPDNTRQLTDYLHARSIPFGVAVIPHLNDPLGVYHQGQAREIPFAQAKALKTALDYMLPRGGRVVAHGWTHQYSNVRNKWTGLSGDDYEFWDMVNNRPVPEDSVRWALGRVNQSLAELGSGAYKPFAFEVPHYQASPKAYAAVRQRMPTSWGRLVYYTSDTPDLNPANPDRDFAVGQFFPYVIREDYYGNKVLPENIGNIQYNLPSMKNTGMLPGGNVLTAQDLLNHAADARVVRDGMASFFFHPFWLTPAFGVPALEDFKSVVEGIEALGYQWADPAAL